MAGLRQKQTNGPRASRVKSSIRVLSLAACIMAVVTPRMSADITLVSRLSDARASAHTAGHDDMPPPQVQTDFLPATLGSSASVPAAKGGTGASASCTSNSSIAVDNSIGTLRVTGNGGIHLLALVQTAFAQVSAKLIVLTFTLTNRSYAYSLTGQLPGSGSVTATARLAAGTSTIFEVVGFANLSETGTLPPGTYTISVDFTGSAQVIGNPIIIDTFPFFNFALDAIPTPTPTPTPTPPSAVNISGSIFDCSNPAPGPVPNVTLTLNGSGSGSTLSDGSGNYTFSSLVSGGSYSVTPSKAARPPGSTGIDTVDVIATQRHFLVLGTPLTGCRLTAAEVTGDSAVNTVDVLAIQRFFLGRTFGTANVGNYQFSPASRTYPAVGSNQTGQNYDTLTFGDVASPFVGP